MPVWIRRRLLLMCMVFFAALIINFSIPRLMPGDITEFFITERFTEEDILLLKQRFGLDQPIITQFWLYIKSVFTGNFGISFNYYPKSVSSMLTRAIPFSLSIFIPAQLTYIFIGYLLGVKAGWKAGSKTDSSIMGISLFIWGAPMFWVAMIILYVFSFLLRWFPFGGYMTLGITYNNIFHKFIDWVYHAFLPMLTLVVCRFSSSAMVMRNTITITLKENYITACHAKGLSETRVKHRHAARNALLPLSTSLTFGIALAISGSVFIEKIFSYPGVGRLIFNAVLMQDYPVIQACFLIFTIMIIVAVLSLDFIYARLDPRIRY